MTDLDDATQQALEAELAPVPPFRQQIGLVQNHKPAPDALHAAVEGLRKLEGEVSALVTHLIGETRSVSQPARNPVDKQPAAIFERIRASTEQIGILTASMHAMLETIRQRI